MSKVSERAHAVGEPQFADEASPGSEASPLARAGSRRTPFLTARPRGGTAASFAFASAVLLAIGSLIVSGGALLDPDVWWHVRTGRLILDSGSIPHTDPWSFTAAPNTWVPTAWLSDVLFAGAWRWGSWDAVRVLRIGLALAVMLSLWSTACRKRGVTPTAAVAAALAILAVAPFLRERPQVLSFLLVAWLAVQADRILHGVMPRLFVCVPVCWLWANLHGMWVLMPTVMLIVGVLAFLDDRRRVSLAARCTLVALLCWSATLLTPVGPRLAFWPLVVRDVAAPITEWQPTLPLTTVGLPLTIILGVIVASWTSSPRPVPTSQVLYVAALALFGLMAFRNVAPAAILLLPVLTRALDVLLPKPAWQIAPSPRATALLLSAAIAVGLTGAGLRLLATPTIAASQPLLIVEELAGRTGEIRVLNSYDVGGLLTGLASPPARVAIDGRTDMWSAAFVRSYINDISGAGDWRGLVDRLDPDVAVLPADGEVARGLVLERGWRVTLADDGWQLLERAP